MKLSDIFSLNLNSKGGAKLFKKIANKYSLDYKEVRKGVEENTNKYGYYDISKLIRRNAANGTVNAAMELFNTVVNTFEITAIFLVHYTAGIFCCSKLSSIVLLNIENIENMIDANNAKVYIKVDENDMNCMIVDINEHVFKADCKGTLIDRLILQGVPKEDIEQFFSQISEEEYERFVIEVNELAGV